VPTEDIIVSEYSDDNVDIYKQFKKTDECVGENYTLFHMIKRGTQHTYAGEVSAASPQVALSCAGTNIERKRPVLNIWLVKSATILKTTEADKDMWTTTPEKLFREAIDYKTQEKLNRFKEGN
jgi:ring-1,2-phenylacetyl-CoA epoxidase subunit PaaB